jgi:3-hydroxyisobutyrate dehydrogenase-like beta-hydroxyacid dehydrogenase
VDIGFIGLGHMGAAMVPNLLKAGHTVTVYNRSPDKAAPLVAQGAVLARTLGEAAQGEAVFTMLAHDSALADVVFTPGGLLDSLPAGTIHISSSTISTLMAERLAEHHAVKGQGFVSAPVFGRPEAAAAAKLFVVAAGAKPSVDRVRPLFDAIGQTTFVVSETPSAANLVKLSGNFLIASVIESLGEAMALASKGGVDKSQYLEILTSTLFGAPVYKTYGGLIAEERYEPAGFAAPLGLKDMRLVLQAADDLQVPLPLASLLHDRFLRLVANGGDNLDWSAIAKLAAEDAGVK